MSPPLVTQDEIVDLTFFVPCLNEEARVVNTLETIRAAMKRLDFSYDVLVVDDGSTDGTAAVVDRYRREHPELPIDLHSNPVNYGLAHSYVDTAFRGRGRYYFLAWGDGGWTSDTLVSILENLGAADLVVPYLASVTGKPPLRRFLSRVYTQLVNLLGGHSLHYYNGGLLCPRYCVLRWAPRNMGFSGFLAELITLMLDQGADIIEVPISATDWKTDQGSSVLTLRNLASTGHSLLNIALRRVRNWMFGRPRAGFEPALGGQLSNARVFDTRSMDHPRFDSISSYVEPGQPSKAA
jgi:glycosyltransferase involved in cell wall biosynthesis